MALAYRRQGDGVTTLCIALALGAVVASFTAERFTLSWTHSVEKIRWEEDYTIHPQHLELVAARIRGSGAGMEIPEDAHYNNGAWEYHPAVAPLPRLTLAASQYAGDYDLCIDGQCQPLTRYTRGASPVELFACRKPSG